MTAFAHERRSRPGVGEDSFPRVAPRAFARWTDPRPVRRGGARHLSEAELDELEAIMGEEDNDLVRWITGEKPLPERYATELFFRIAAYRPDFDPVRHETK